MAQTSIPRVIMVGADLVTLSEGLEVNLHGKTWTAHFSQEDGRWYLEDTEGYSFVPSQAEKNAA